jgi:hypothetical protein
LPPLEWWENLSRFSKILGLFSDQNPPKSQLHIYFYYIDRQTTSNVRVEGQLPFGSYVTFTTEGLKTTACGDGISRCRKYGELRKVRHSPHLLSPAMILASLFIVGIFDLVSNVGPKYHCSPKHHVLRGKDAGADWRKQSWSWERKYRCRLLEYFCW